MGEKDLQTTKPTNDQYLDYVENSQNSIAEKENSQNMGKRYKETKKKTNKQKKTTFNYHF